MVKKKEQTEEPLEKQLWKAADKLRKNIDAAEYKHVVLGLIFLKYISVSFEKLYAELVKLKDEGADPEDKEEYKAENIFFVPANARWSYLVSQAKNPLIGKYIDDAMDVIERENPSLKGVLPKVFSRPNLDPTSIGELIDLIGNSTLSNVSTGSADLLGHVFEYFLGEFALAEGKKGGQFYTPRSVVELLVNMLEPYKGRVLDPCCGSGGMFVQSEKFVKEHQGRIDNISVYGQESNQTTWRLCKMNLAIRGIDASNVKFSTHVATVVFPAGCTAKFFNFMKDNGYEMETAGISYYPSAPSMALSKKGLLKKTVKKINKKCGLNVFIGEFSYPSGKMDGPFAGWNKKVKGYKHDQQGQANIYADVIKWGKANGMAGIRYWAPDYEGWYAMSMFEFSNKKGTAKSILTNHKGLIEK